MRRILLSKTLICLFLVCARALQPDRLLTSCSRSCFFRSLYDLRDALQRLTHWECTLSRSFMRCTAALICFCNATCLLTRATNAEAFSTARRRNLWRMFERVRQLTIVEISILSMRPLVPQSPFRHHHAFFPHLGGASNRSKCEGHSTQVQHTGHAPQAEQNRLYVERRVMRRSARICSVRCTQ